jgi:hypothetical protein
MREPGCFERQQQGASARRVELGQAAVKPEVPGVGTGPILRIIENDKAPATTVHQIGQALTLRSSRSCSKLLLDP